MNDSELDATRIQIGRSDTARIEALERNLMSLERVVYDLQRDLQDVKKALKDRK